MFQTLLSASKQLTCDPALPTTPMPPVCTLPAGIPVGDLFVAMESWEEPDSIKASMDVILEIEAEASKNISAKQGLLELLQLLADSKVCGRQQWVGGATCWRGGRVI